MISVIVTAYKSADFIEECLESIVHQKYGKDYEIIVGVDGCEETLAKINSLDESITSNITVYYLPENVGTYITSNTIISLSSGDFILRFDSDDIMMPNLLLEFDKEKKEDQIIQFSAIEINGTRKRIKTNLHGCAGFSKSLFHSLGGYKGWRCAADTDLIKRAATERVTTKVIKEPLFYRRYHKDSLTSNPLTGRRSPLRMRLASEVGLPKRNKGIEVSKVEKQ